MPDRAVDAHVAVGSGEVLVHAPLAAQQVGRIGQRRVSCELTQQPGHRVDDFLVRAELHVGGLATAHRRAQHVLGIRELLHHRDTCAIKLNKFAGKF